MARKIGQITCISLFVLFAASWAASYWRISYDGGNANYFSLAQGLFQLMLPTEDWLMTLSEADLHPTGEKAWLIFGFDGLKTIWIPERFFHERYGGYQKFRLPLWMPTLLMGVVCYFVVWRRRHREGCCKKCNYDLTGNVSGVCSECGEPT